MKKLNTKPNKLMGFLIYDGVQAMDVLGPWEVFSTWKNFLDAPIDLMLIAQDKHKIQCENQLEFKAHLSLSEAPTLDFLLIPGGPGRIAQVQNHELINFIKAQYRHCEYLLSVCTGAFLVQAAELVDNYSATTYWRAIRELAQFKSVDIVEQRIVHDGKIWSAGGISSGLDLAFAFIEHIAGRETAGQLQLLFEYFPSQPRYANKKLFNELPSYPYASSNGNADWDALPQYIKRWMENDKDME